MPAPILHLTDIRKSYNVGTPVETEVLHGITLATTGQSGSIYF